jgi:hypothetical protein
VQFRRGRRNTVRSVVAYYTFTTVPQLTCHVNCFSERDSVEITSPVSRGEYDYLIDRCRLHHLEAPSRWAPPVVEVWLTWAVDEEGELRSCEKLLGLAKFPSKYKLGTTVVLAVRDVTRGVQRGTLRAACVVGADANNVETSAHCVLNAYHIERQARPAKVRPPDVVAPTESAVVRDVAQQSSLLSQSKRVSQAQQTTATTESMPGHQQAKAPASSPPAVESKPDDVELTEDDVLFLLNQVDHDTDRTAPQTQPTERYDVPSSQTSSPVQAPDPDVPLLTDLTSTVEADAASDDGGMPTDRAVPGTSAQFSQSRSVQSTHGGARSHLLEFSVDGAFQLLQPRAQDAPQYAIFGCFVCYTLSSHDVRSSGAEKAQLWWDADCPVMNGTQRHHIETQELGTLALAAALGRDADEFVSLRLCAADTEGNIQGPEVLLGTAELPLSQLSDFMDAEMGYATFTLPVHLTPSAERLFYVMTSTPELVLKVSHRVEPVLLRRSAAQLDQSFLSADSLKQDTSSIAAEETKDATSSRLDQSLHSPHDPAAALLGFEITAADLEGMVFFRDPQLPLPWVPFQDRREDGLTLHEAAAQSLSASAAATPSLEGALALRLGEGGAEGDYISLRKTLLALESITPDMLSPGDGREAVLGTNQAAHETVGTSSALRRFSEHVTRAEEDQPKEQCRSGDEEVNTAQLHEDEDAVSDEELYPSDFESLEDAGTAESLLQRLREHLEREHVSSGAAAAPMAYASTPASGPRQVDFTARRSNAAGIAEQQDASEEEGSGSTDAAGPALDDAGAAPGASSVRSSLRSVSTDSSDSAPASLAAAPHTEGAEWQGFVADLSEDERSEPAASAEDDSLHSSYSGNFCSDGAGEPETKDDFGDFTVWSRASDEFDQPRYDDDDDAADGDESAGSEGGEEAVRSGTGTGEDSAVVSEEETRDVAQNSPSEHSPASRAPTPEPRILDASASEVRSEADDSDASWHFDDTTGFSHASAHDGVNSSLREKHVDEYSTRPLAPDHATAADVQTQPGADSFRNPGDDASMQAPDAGAQASGAVPTELPATPVSAPRAQDVAPAADQYSLLDEDGQADSPNTSKIKGVVDARLSEVFGPEVVAHPLPQRCEPFIVPKPAAVTTWTPLERPLTESHKTERTVRVCSAAGASLLSAQEQERLRIRHLVESQARRLETSSLQGQKGKDLKAENERVSRLMMKSVFRRVGAV